jgi:hypothetical protein
MPPTTASTAELAPQADAPPASALVSELIRAWPVQHPFSAKHILQEHPDWADRESLVLDLAGEEYLRRARAGETLPVTDFVRNYPAVAADLRRLILIDQSAESFGDVEPQWPVEGDVVDRFHLLEQLGRGALSRVFLAEDLSLDHRRVVLKFVPLGSSEAALQARTEHDCVMPVLHVALAETRGLMAICMPFAGRATLCHATSVLVQYPARKRTTARLLEDFIASGAIDPDQPLVQRLRKSSEHSVEFVLRIGIALAEACAAAHERGVMHRDLKPSNVLLSFGAEPLLLDFNLALSSEAAKYTGGTAPYMPPERLRALLSDPPTPLEETAASDVFSLGATLFEVLTGEPPFGFPEGSLSRTEMLSAMLARQARGPLSLPRLNPCVNRSLTRIIESTLQFEPSSRPQSMRAVAAALRAELGIVQRWKRAICCRPVRTIATTAAAVALVATTVSLSVWAWDHWRPQFGLAAVHRGASGSDAQSLEQLGRERLEAGDAVAALALFRQAYEQEPNGQRAELAAIAALRNRKNSATARYYLERADELGYSGVEHVNNWAVCEFRSGSVSEARRRLTSLLDSAPHDALPTVLLNWMEAESRLSDIEHRGPDLEILRHPLTRITPGAWHSFQASNLYALALKKSDDSETRADLLSRLCDATRLAVLGGVPRDRIEQIETLCPQLLDEPNWENAVRLAASGGVPEPERTLIPR